MIRVRFYRFVLSAPPLICGFGLLYFFIKPLNMLSLNVPLGWAVAALGAVLMPIFYIVFSCPCCGKSPYAFGQGAFSFFGSPFPQTKCSSCGFDMKSGMGCADKVDSKSPDQ